ncbi:hypothetical protein [Citricoccus sp. GCM10030269]|uniref:hypothetical protein n=1 Tax=Citricoccus sp. GCM10030269 TaxID=3273388 RepID=UPI00361795A5
MTDYENIEQLGQEVRADGIVPVTLQNLREMLGYKKLGVRVLAEIAQSLQADGFGYFPLETLENNEQPRQGEEVRIFELSSPVGKVVTAVQKPSVKNDTFLKEISDSKGSEAASILDQIRTLIDG